MSVLDAVFQLYEIHFPGCNARADVVFLLDSSGSVGHVDFRRVKQFAADMISELSIGRDHTRVGLATYSSRSRYSYIYFQTGLKPAPHGH